MTLNQAPLNTTLVLVGSTNLDDAQARRLSALGLRTGAQVRLVQRLAEINGIGNPDVIYPGQVLTVG